MQCDRPHLASVRSCAMCSSRRTPRTRPSRRTTPTRAAPRREDRRDRGLHRSSAVRRGFLLCAVHVIRAGAQIVGDETRCRGAGDAPHQLREHVHVQAVGGSTQKPSSRVEDSTALELATCLATWRVRTECGARDDDGRCSTMPSMTCTAC